MYVHTVIDKTSETITKLLDVNVNGLELFVVVFHKVFQVVVRVKYEARSSDETELLHFSLSSLDLLALFITPVNRLTNMIIPL